jgi:DNA-binding GntR family transcriptional regulator
LDTQHDVALDALRSSPRWVDWLNSSFELTLYSAAVNSYCARCRSAFWLFRRRRQRFRLAALASAEQAEIQIRATG